MQVSDRAIRSLSSEEIGALEKAATSVDTVGTEYMDGRVFDLSLKAKDAGDERLADTYRLLAGVLRSRVELMGDIDSSTNQFHVTPSSMTNDEHALLATLVEHVGDPELRARFADYPWIAKRDRKYGEIAVDDYLASALCLRDPEKWPGCVGRYERAAKLAASLGKKNERFTRTLAGQRFDLPPQPARQRRQRTPDRIEGPDEIRPERLIRDLRSRHRSNSTSDDVSSRAARPNSRTRSGAPTMMILPLTPPSPPIVYPESDARKRFPFLAAALHEIRTREPGVANSARLGRPNAQSHCFQ
jgi:hypothetical protein